MSSTSAVAVLAQGLRELRDFAEGPDGEDLRERTGLTAEQIDAALGGELLPTREVTLALVEAWEGDVEAWREYWGQISELAREDEDGPAEKAKTTPAPPEPSIITPIPEVEPEEVEEVPEREEAPETEEAPEAKEAPAAEEPQEPDREEVESPEAEPEAVAEEAEPAIVAEAPARAESASVAAPVESKSRVESKSTKKSPLVHVGIPVLLFAVGVGVGAFGDHALNSKQSSTTTAASVPAVTTSSRPSHTAALSPSGSGAASSASPSGTPGGGPSGSTSSTDAATSASASSTVAPGTVLGAYVGIQLAAGYSVNFLADSYHPAAGTSDGPDTMGFFADSFVDGRFYADRVAILNPTDTGSFTSCLNDTRYQRDVLLSQISTGSSFCVTTSTGHLVLVTVRRLPSSTDANPYAVLDVTVWQGGSTT